MGRFSVFLDLREHARKDFQAQVLLEHIARSVPRPSRLQIHPPTCEVCGYRFKDRAKFNDPSYEVCRRLKQEPPTRLIPIVLLTALAAEEARIRGIEAGADDFITKPFSRAELKARVRSLLRLKKFTDELEHAEAMLLALGRTVEAKDPYTQGHCE